MNIAELIKEVLDSAKERVKTPIVGAYIISFIFWNWRPLSILLFDDNPIRKKIWIIDDYYPNKCEVILIPLLIALVYAIVVPYLMALIDKSSEFANRKRLKMQYIRKSEDLKEQLAIVKLELEVQDKKNRSKTTEDFENQISDLQSRIETAEETHKNNVIIYENRIKELNQTVTNILKEKEDANRELFSEKEDAEFAKIFLNNGLTRKSLQIILTTKFDTKTIFPVDILEKEMLSLLVENDLLESHKNGYRFTSRGIDFIKYIARNVRPEE